MSSKFFLIFLFKFIASINIGTIKYASIRTNTSLISTSSSQCIDCLCQCLSNRESLNTTISKCYGINCFPSNNSCQRIESQWIEDNDLLFNSTSDQFIQTIDIHFCSYYSSQNLLDHYENITPVTISHSMARLIIYNSYDETLLVLGNNLIAQYFVSNLTRFRSWSVSNIPLMIVIDSINIFISFYNNASVNIYDKQMNYMNSIQRPIRSFDSGGFYGMVRWNNFLLITDDVLELIWSINLDTMSMSVYINLTNYNIKPFNLFVFNDYLYISQFSSSIIYILNLNTFYIQNLIVPNSIPLYRLQKDPFCNRLWFGVNQGTYPLVPVLDLTTNEIHLYQSKGLLSTSTVYQVTFDSNYSLYTVAINTNGFSKFSMTDWTCSGK